jgi:threonine synthase
MKAQSTPGPNKKHRIGTARNIVRRSGGILALSDEVILDSLRDWAKHDGIFLSPEGAAATAAYNHLSGTGFRKPSDRVVLFNTGAGLKYTDI